MKKAPGIQAPNRDPADARGVRRRPVQRRSLERCERILNACAALLDEAGYAGMTTTEVARRAGVPIGTLYQFFADKDALIQALAARNLDSYLIRLETRFADDTGRPAEARTKVDLAVDVAVEEFVTMRRTVPGFAVVDFGAGGAVPDNRHLLDAAVDNNTAVARRITALTGLAAGDDPARRAELETATRVALECADAVLKLAFRNDPDGDPVLIGECKRVLRRYLGGFSS